MNKVSLELLKFTEDMLNEAYQWAIEKCQFEGTREELTSCLVEFFLDKNNQEELRKILADDGDSCDEKSKVSSGRH